jgi:hypothetical protein
MSLIFPYVQLGATWKRLGVIKSMVSVPFVVLLLLGGALTAGMQRLAAYSDRRVPKVMPGVVVMV